MPFFSSASDAAATAAVALFVTYYIYLLCYVAYFDGSFVIAADAHTNCGASSMVSVCV